MIKNKKCIGGILTIPKFVKEEYLSKRKKHAMAIFIEIHSDKRYGAVAKIYERNSLFDRWEETTTKKQRQEFSKGLEKAGKRKKPLDTSKWVKPDEETIRNALVESLFALEILKEDSNKYDEYYGKAQAFYSILHNHSPKNPQVLSNWCIDPYFRYIMDELKCLESKKYWAKFNNDFKKKNKTKDHWSKRQEEYNEWKKRCLKNMIVPDKKSHKFKDIFKETRKLIEKNEKNNKNN